jgi:hypothetical protein
VPLTELRFQYTGQNCADGSDPNECQDQNGGPSGVTEVFVEIFDDDGTPYVEAVFQLEDIITVRNPSGFTTGEIEIVIYRVDRDQDDNIGDQIQTLVINTDCDDGSLVLERDYGALMLTAFDNEVDGLQTLFATYTIIYLIENDSVFDATITEGVVGSTISGPSTERVPTPIFVERFETARIFEESETINLRDAATAVQAFIFRMDVAGFAATNQMRDCTDDVLIFFTVAAAAA